MRCPGDDIEFVAAAGRPLDLAAAEKPEGLEARKLGPSHCCTEGPENGRWGLRSGISFQKTCVGLRSNDVILYSNYVAQCISFGRVLEQWLGGWRLDISRVLSNIRSFGRCPISFGWSAGMEMWI